ncbi:hypothetical protein [Dyadobacter sp. NIV53]|uniref:hypothetical protein n=1 Tax=Dyadobacter sp. NIV53 TaxID=2861765 RepID=UPI001C874FE9|nr:hypothetical protein [Dyadobacter sp. NIV53]
MKNKLLISRPTPTEVTILDKWLIGHESNGWKYTDAPMFIGSDINFINVAPLKASSELRLNASCILFNFVSEKDTTYTEFKGFKYIMPLLTKSLEDFDRLNNFSKVLALVRWAAINNAIFLNKPTEPSFLNKPLVIKADDTGISIFDTVKEVRASYGYK